jgi:nucleotidyltransferase substrate binding protein (TIGR01987 family)
MAELFSVKELESAVASLHESLELLNDKNIIDKKILKAIRDACIQRFEYCIELSWKTSMKILGSKTVAAIPAIREMARSNLIKDPSLWLDFIDARNESSHSYDEIVAEKVLTKIKIFYPESLMLLDVLKKAI